jgi:hypothetical protein
LPFSLLLFFFFSFSFLFFSHLISSHLISSHLISSHSFIHSFTTQITTQIGCTITNSSTSHSSHLIHNTNRIYNHEFTINTIARNIKKQHQNRHCHKPKSIKFLTLFLLVPAGAFSDRARSRRRPHPRRARARPLAPLPPGGPSRPAWSKSLEEEERERWESEEIRMREVGRRHRE